MVLKRPCISLILLSFFLLSCGNGGGGGDGDGGASTTSTSASSSSSTSSSSSASSSSSTSSSSGNPVQIAAGQAEFERQCASCHNGGALFRDLQSLESAGTLVSKIANDMPPSRPASCEGECSELIAAYLRDEYDLLAPSGSSSSSSSSSNSSSGGFVGNTVRGEAIFEAQCSICHAGGAQFVDINALDATAGALFDKVNDDMPTSDPGLCVGQCAADVADYVRLEFKTSGEAETPLEKLALQPQHYVRKAKTLLTGQAVSKEELAAVNVDAGALSGLIRSWQQTDAYQEKLTWFLTEYMQDAFEIPRRAYSGQVRGNTDVALMFRFVNPLIWENAADHSVKTYLNLIVNEQQPFTNITSQTEWMMTPALMSMYMAIDQRRFTSEDEDFYIRTFPSELADENTPMAEQIANKAFYFPKPVGTDFPTAVRAPNQNNDEYVGNELGRVWGYLNEFSTHTSNESKKLFVDSDYTTWKKVRLVQRSADDAYVDFWDLPSIRESDTLYLDTPRMGFMTNPNFFTRWQTNQDNQWRVTVNQMLIVALNQSFVPNNSSVSLNDESLSDDHAQPGTDCYGCHKLVDPMRNYHQKWFDDLFGKPRGVPLTGVENSPAFSFQGHTQTGSELEDLSSALATHPAFASGWVQKMCYYVNSKACYEKDPDFIAVAEAFEGSGFNFNFLIEVFFSSKLVSSDVEEVSERSQADYGSLSRRQHFCQMLAVRLSRVAGARVDPCDENGNSVSTMAEALPNEEWTRGALSPAQPTRPDLFYQTTVENICRGIARNHYGSAAFPATDIESFLDDYLLPEILGIPDNDTRYPELRSVLLDHYTQGALLTRNARTLFSSVFTLACSSPLMSSVDF